MSKVCPCNFIAYLSSTMPSLICIKCICFLCVQLATLTGHTFKVLYLAISPDGQVSFALLISKDLTFFGFVILFKVMPIVICSHLIFLITKLIENKLCGAYLLFYK